MHWHGQTVAAFSLQLFTLSCASETVTFKKKLCSLLGSKQWQGLNFFLPLVQLSSRQLSLEGLFFNRNIYLCIYRKWKYWTFCQSNAVLGTCQQCQKKIRFSDPSAINTPVRSLSLSPSPSTRWGGHRTL